MQFDIRRVDDTASTNDDAKEAAAQNAPEGTVLWALQQSAGRGRYGRQWQSPLGNLYFSVVLRPKNNFACYSFIASLAIAEAIRKILPKTNIELKWPNDVLVGGKKISGILLEAADDALIIGIGVNVAVTPENPLYPVTSLALETPIPPTLETLLNDILHSLAVWCATADAQGFAPIRTAWLAQARKGAMRVKLSSGEIHGDFVDLDETGNLRLILADKTIKTVAAGDVFF